MGTQQILLIVLSVIIVGIAVAVGITMFNAQATNSNRQAVMSDMNNLASSCLAFYKTPVSHGGGGGEWLTANIDDLGNWLGYEYDSSDNSCTTGNGVFIIGITDTDNMTIDGIGTEIGNDDAYSNANGDAGFVEGDITIEGSTSLIVASISN